MSTFSFYFFSAARALGYAVIILVSLLLVTNWITVEEWKTYLLIALGLLVVSIDALKTEKGRGNVSR